MLAKQNWLFDSENNFLRNVKALPASTEIAANEILLYPNPSESQLNIRYNFDKDSKLQIVDMLGIIVKEVFLSKETKQVSLFVNDLVLGVYSYRHIYNKNNG
ncbi:MAG: T9SS type A sorting domain-containing protein [Bacteroidetes bacterium]|nr:T9SS type A sorting domain-containing protein [Bacteroidota bacterium]MBK6819244.1 T9SS type A sorting domain-containing protein [Bacteroidota bacterium]MBK7588326.1 T9SS type A sorting domain-containing protein [Bacteroidota bacterium]